MKSGSRDERKYWWLGMISARHVLFDEVEAEKAVVTFFDQGENKAVTVLGREIGEKRVMGVKVQKFGGENLSQTGGDSVELDLYTHDQELGEVLNEWWWKRNQLRGVLFETHNEMT